MLRTRAPRPPGDEAGNIRAARRLNIPRTGRVAPGASHRALRSPSARRVGQRRPAVWLALPYLLGRVRRGRVRVATERQRRDRFEAAAPERQRRVRTGRDAPRRRSALRADCPALLAPAARRRTHFVRFAHCVRTTAPSQITKRAARAAASAAMLGASQSRPGLSEPAFAEAVVVSAARRDVAASRQALPAGGEVWGGEKRRPGVGACSALRDLRSCERTQRDRSSRRARPARRCKCSP